MRKITKIILSISLFIGRVVTAQEYYTCVPTRDWWLDIVREVTKERDEIEKKRKEEERKRKLQERFEKAKSEINDSSVWKLVEKNKTSGTLESDVYKAEVAGGKGGKGGNATVNANGPGSGACYNTYKGGAGGKGEITKKVFLLYNNTSFNATIGKKGKDGEDKSVQNDEVNGGKGENGKESSIKIYGIINLKANGGDKGNPAFNDDTLCGRGWGNSACSCRNGTAGSKYSVGNDGDGYVKIYKYTG